MVIPLYNHERFIAQAIDSLLAQTLKPHEIIVVDDGSTDRSAQVLGHLCAVHPEIIFWSQPNQGAHYALNAAIHRATGEFIAILNSDDVYAPERLEACLAVMGEAPALAAVFTGVSFLDEAANPVANPWYDRARNYFEEEGDLSLALANANLVVSTSNLFLRRSVFSRMGYFAPLRYTHDLDFCLRLLACGEKVGFLDRPLLGYRLHGRNTIAENGRRVDVERAAVLAFFLYSRWRSQAESMPWDSYLPRLAKVLESHSLTECLRHFLSYLTGGPSDAEATLQRPPDGELRAYLHAAGLDWRGTDHTRQLLARLDTAVADERASAIAQQRAWIASLEAGKEWLAGHARRLEETLTQRDALIAEQRDWTNRLEEAKQWIEGQMAAQARQVLTLQQQLGEAEAFSRTQQEWVDRLVGTWPWRVLRALKLAPAPPRRAVHSEPT